MILDLTRLYVRYLGWTLTETASQFRFRVPRAIKAWCPAWCPCSAWEDA